MVTWLPGTGGLWFWHDVDTPIDGDVVSFSTFIVGLQWDEPQVTRSTLRFLDAATLSSFLSAAGLVVEDQFGDWTAAPLTGSSPEIITIARRG